MVAFQGPDQVVDWKLFFDDWAIRQGWRPVTKWQTVGSACHARFVQAEGTAIDIRLATDGNGGLSGLLITTPGGTGLQ